MVSFRRKQTPTLLAAKRRKNTAQRRKPWEMFGKGTTSVVPQSQETIPGVDAEKAAFKPKDGLNGHRGSHHLTSESLR